MKKNWKLATLALATTGMMLTTACTEDNIGDSGIDDFACNLLNADITEDVTLKAGETYTLDGGIHVKNGATLKIEPGVKIEAIHDNKVDYILIEKPEHGADFTSADTHLQTWAQAHQKSVTPHTEATMPTTIPAFCATSAWNTPAMPSAKTRNQTVSHSTAWAAELQWITYRLSWVPTTVSSSSAAR